MLYYKCISVCIFYSVGVCWRVLACVLNRNVTAMQYHLFVLILYFAVGSDTCADREGGGGGKGSAHP